MKPCSSVFCSLIVFIVFSCETGPKHFELVFNQNPPQYQLGDTLKVSIQNSKKQPIDSVVYFYGDNRLKKVDGNTKLSVKLEKQKLGKHPFSAKIYSGGNMIETKSSVKLLSDKKPIIYTYEVINTYPHDINAYTQGLDFYEGALYESTGRHGASSLRKVDLETGKVLKEIDLDKKYFGEGITVLNDKIYMLTWRAGKGFIFDVDSFEKLGSFEFDQSKEGWGLTTDGEVLYKSDGTEKIWILDPKTLEEIRSIQTVTNHGITTKLNELEWVEGKIYANTYLKDGVVIINSKNGAVVGLIDFRGLRDKVTQHPKLDVLNGIAYDPDTKKLYVTGKNWDKLFEVEITKK